MAAYYNEIDPYAAQWLRNLIDAGHIAPGVVDERSIEDVLPGDLAGFTQCHFFAGIGVWSLALRRACWPDDRPVWTGSCPCQPFSAAGQGAGFDDERHLWPAFFHLIQERRPAVVFGEQVASSNVDPWLDLVQADLEALGHAFGCVAFPSAGVGAPHIRDRAFWVGIANGVRTGRHRRAVPGQVRGQDRQHVPFDAGAPGRVRQLADADHDDGSRRPSEAHGDGPVQPDRCGDAGRVEHADHGGDRPQEPTSGHRQPKADRPSDFAGRSGVSPVARPGPTNGLWSSADWLACTDGRWRPVEPGTSPLAHGAPARVGRLRAYGNAINAEAARIFIEATM